MKTTLLFTLLCASTASLAATPTSPVGQRYTRAYTACLQSGDAAEGVPAAVVECGASEIDRQNAVLNAKYVALMRRLPAPKKASLRASERTWITTRDRQCQAEIADDPGTLSQVVYTDCILDETIKRILWIERYR
jgi:uncharacterized protein YecT (DUF1311 family)